MYGAYTGTIGCIVFIQCLPEMDSWCYDPIPCAQAVQYYIELLEHTDQTVRIGACAGLGTLGVRNAQSCDHMYRI